MRAAAEEIGIGPWPACQFLRRFLLSLLCDNAVDLIKIPFDPRRTMSGGLEGSFGDAFNSI